MSNRISRTELHLTMAALIARRGTCARAQVGCIITRDNRIVASGYNGPPTGRNCKDLFSMCDVLKPCTKAVHAEANAIAFAARFGIPLSGTVLYCTHQPCTKCGELIIQSGIEHVHFIHKYHTPGEGIIGSSYTPLMGTDGMFKHHGALEQDIHMPTLYKMLEING